MGITPDLELTLAKVAVGHIQSAGITDFAVDDHNLSVVAVIKLGGKIGQ